MMELERLMREMESLQRSITLIEGKLERIENKVERIDFISQTFASGRGQAIINTRRMGM